MYSRFPFILAIGLAFISLLPCHSMDRGSVDTNSEAYKKFEREILPFLKAIPEFAENTKIIEFHQKTRDLEDSPQKAAQLGEVVQKATTALKKLNPSHGMMYTMMVQLKAMSLKEQGGLMYVQCFPIDPIPSEEKLGSLRKINELLTLSCDTFRLVKDQQNETCSEEYLWKSTHTLAHACSQRGWAEKDPSQALLLFAESIKCMKDVETYLPKSSGITDIQMILALSLCKLVDIHNKVSCVYDELCQSTTPQKDRVNLFLANAKLTKQCAVFVADHLNEDVIGFSISTVRARIGSNTSAIASILKSLPPVMNASELIKVLNSTHCGALRGASLALLDTPIDLNFSESQREGLKEGYRKKSDTVLEQSIKAYEETLYQKEYENDPVKKEAFIRARLDDFTGNPEPLKEFYQNLRKERRLALKEKAHQKMVETIQESQRLFLEEKRKQEEKRLARLDENSNLSKAVKTQPPAVEPIVSPFEVEGPGGHKSPKSIHLPPKVKKHAATPGVVPVQEEEEDSDIEEEVKVKLLLGYDDFRVFHCLTGGMVNRNITLDQVIDLLTSKAIGCNISMGKGSHRKATAPNGAMWTIPPAWDGPIPPNYRQQLNHFLQADLDIDPQDVEERKV